VDGTHDVLARIDALEAEVRVLRKTVPRTPPADETAPSSRVADRRGVVKLLAASAVGAVTGVALPGRSVAADDGDPVLLGNENFATGETRIISSGATALVAGSGNGYGLLADGLRGNAWFFASGGAPTGFAGDAGALWVDGDGNWWAATASSADDGQWRKLAGPGTSGSLHLLPAPIRVYDSRPGLPPTIEPKAPLAPNGARTIDTTGNSSGVPPAARGALITLTVTGTGGAGFASVWPSGAWPGTSSVNFTEGGATVATTTVAGLSSATFQILASTTTDVLIDVIGYYL
jgi:hypothetical protein